MIKVKNAVAATAAIVVVAAVMFLVSRWDDAATEADHATAPVVEDLPAEEPPMTTEQIPQPAASGFVQPSSDVVGVSKP